MAYPSNRQPTVSSDDAARDQIRAFVERILRMKEEAKAINDDIREIYAEAKGNGFDKTVLGQVVSFVEKRAKDPATLAERSALFELYVTAFDGGDEADDETGTPVALPHTHEVVDHDPVTGEIIEPNSPEIPDSSKEHESTAVDLDGGDGKNAPVPSVDTNEPEGTDQSTAARMDVPVAPQGLDGSDLDQHEGPNGRVAVKAEAGTQAPLVDNNSDALPVSEDEGSNTALTAEAAPSVSATNSAPNDGEAGESPAPASEPTAEEGGAGASASSVVRSNIIKLNGKPLRPFCQHQDDLTKCGGYGRVHCHDCLKAHAEDQGMTA